MDHSDVRQPISGLDADVEQQQMIDHIAQICLDQSIEKLAQLITSYGPTLFS